MAHVQKRTRKDGTIVYRAIVRRGSNPRMTRSFDRRRDAARWAERKRAEILEGRLPANERAEAHRCDEVFERFEREILPTKENAGYRRSMACHMRFWQKLLGKTRLCDLTDGAIAEGRDALVASGRKGSTANRYLFTLSAVCSHACREWRWLAENPVASVRKMKEPPPPSRHLTAKERCALLDAAAEEKKPIRLMILLALTTGGRKNQLRGVAVRDVDVEGERIHFERMKGGKSMVCVIHKDVMKDVAAHIAALPEGARTLFDSDMDRIWRRVRVRAGLPKLRFHDLRHAFGSSLNDAGATAFEIKKLMNHSKIETSERYVHGFDRRAAMASLAAQHATLTSVTNAEAT